MDISVLTEQRREMVINLLKGMKIRKSDGDGFDKDDVYACMQQLCDVYEKSIDDLTVNYETEIGELQDKYQKYDENNDLYISLIMEAKKSSNEIINKAKSEVDEILAAGKEQIALQEEEIEKFRASVEQEKAELNADLEAARAAAQKEKEDLAAGIEAEKKNAETTREQYRDQIAVMDQEFDEIKMNILRTAGKIDGLKAQLEEAGEEARWEVETEQAAVDVPQSDLVIEETAEPEAPAEEPEELTFEQLVEKLQKEDAAKAGEVEVVEAPAPAPAVEAEPEPEAEFHFEPVFDTPAEAPAVETAEPAEAPEIEIEVPTEAPVEVPIEEVAAVEEEIPVEIPAEAAPEIPVEEVPLEAAAEEAAAEAEGLADIGELSLEEIPVEAPEEIVVEEEPIEEISFEGLEELFKE